MWNNLKKHRVWERIMNISPINQIPNTSVYQLALWMLSMTMTGHDLKGKMLMFAYMKLIALWNGLLAFSWWFQLIPQQMWLTDWSIVRSSWCDQLPSLLDLISERIEEGRECLYGLFPNVCKSWNCINADCWWAFSNWRALHLCITNLNLELN